jgi:UMF1 family MFS transporter
MAERRDNAMLLSWGLYDWASSGFPTLIQTFVFPAYFAKALIGDGAEATSSWGLAIGIAGFLVAVGGPVLGAVADQSGRRKPWIGVFSAIAVLTALALWSAKPAPSSALPALILVGIGTVAVEYASIFYNSMLPALAPPARIGRWSGLGWAMGYAGGLGCLALALLVLIRPDPPLFGLDPAAAEPVRATFVLVGLWYALFTLPFFARVPDPRGPRRPLSGAIRGAFRQLADTVRRARRYRGVLGFLGARMIYIDGLATLFAFGGLYAATAFGMSEQKVLLFGIALNVTAGLGAAGFALVDDRIGAKRTILLTLAGLIVPSTLILLVRQEALFWALGLMIGIFVGPVQAASRSYLARTAPAAMRTELFGLFAFSGKATSFLGPLLVSTLTVATGSQRLGMAVIVVLFVVGLLLMLAVPADDPKAAPPG